MLAPVEHAVCAQSDQLQRRAARRAWLSPVISFTDTPSRRARRSLSRRTFLRAVEERQEAGECQLALVVAAEWASRRLQCASRPRGRRMPWLHQAS